MPSWQHAPEARRPEGSGRDMHGGPSAAASPQASVLPSPVSLVAVQIRVEGE
jgi:hypothetical protein